MYRCEFCGAETAPFANRVPICLDCAAALEKHEGKDRKESEKSASV
jgi:hypothetical protein